MDWVDDGIVIASRKHGESAVILSLLTREHGRHAGLVRGGASARARGLYQTGNLLRANWRGRLADHLGGFTCEMLRGYAGPLLDDQQRLGALGAFCALLERGLPEREPHPALFEDSLHLLDLLSLPASASQAQEGAAEQWAPAYVRWELALLRDLGYGLDLQSCAITGETDGLAFVSPNTGRAVTAEAGLPWRDKLLPLPEFLQADSDAYGVELAAVRDGLALTGWFLDRHVFAPQNLNLPAARTRFVEAFR
jgi:DNA repair protein RecO (recombination protein O)